MFSGDAFDVSSAGSSALDGLPASALAVKVAKDHSIDLSNHQSRLLNRTLVKEADLIVTMGAKHKETVGVIEPSALGYTYLLTEFCDGEDSDIPDPIGMGEEDYRDTFEAIEECLSEMVKKIDSFQGWKSE